MRQAVSVRKARLIIVLMALLLCAGMLMSALALGGPLAISGDYGIIANASISQHEDCEPGEVWVPSLTNPIAGECVAE